MSRGLLVIGLEAHRTQHDAAELRAAIEKQIGDDYEVFVISGVTAVAIQPGYVELEPIEGNTDVPK